MNVNETKGDAVNFAEHHAEKLPYLGVGTERSELTPRGGLVIESRNARGELTGRDVFTAEDLRNALTDEGVNDLWATYFAASGRTAGNTWYLGLATAAPSAGSTLATISEAATGNQPGYARVAITWDFGTSRHAKTGNRVFTATGAWTAGVTHLFLTNVASGTSGKLFNYLALSATRQPAANGDTITVSWDGSL